MRGKPPNAGLGRREREIMDVLFRIGEGSVSDVRVNLPEPPSYSAVRTMLTLLETKGHVRHERLGKRFIYKPTMAPGTVRRSALRYVLQTFFGGSEQELVATLVRERTMDEATRAELQRLIREADRS